ncbi:hypothetical protein OG921_01065 [Aldersonia sp. NBC_00410]|uniref:hypothetical protein n=1 Tax=Aldersonia sp. NBC_00410 TaxID=2975954 RepID=UPI002250DBE7|nr:hypothetical protein [Aldersonia sp. NBC_00410]MCX5041781.1 hypothetical protein [Aldersonia sp. NBC_00410]
MEGRSRRQLSERSVLVAALALLGGALLVRGVIAANGDFYWDDLILVGRGSSNGLFSADLLLRDHDGHFMPAAFFVAAITTKLAPLQWVWPAVTLVAMQAAAGLAVLRLLRLLLGARPALLAVFAFYLFSPLTLPSFAWWAAALNSLPMQFALAWVAGDALLLARTGRCRYAASGVIVFALSLAFFEKSVLVPFVAFAVVALCARIDGRSRPVRTVLRAGRALWIPCAALLGCWTVLYLTIVESRPMFAHLSGVPGLIWHTTALGLFPAAVGGPLRWDRWPPSPPWASPPGALVWLALAVVVVAVAAACYYKRGAVAVWLGVAGYVAVCEAAMIVTRSSDGTAYELGQTLRYVADAAVIIAIALALTVRAPMRAGVTVPRPAADPRARTIAVAALVVVFTIGSVVSSVSFQRAWRNNPTTDYLANARVALATHRDVPLLDEPVSIWVLLPVAYPSNMVSSVFDALPDRPEFTTSTPQLRKLDDSGRMVEAVVTWTRAIPQGPEPDCGFRVPAGAPGQDAPVTELPLDGPLLNWGWTAQLNYFADRDGTIEVGLPDGAPVEVAVAAGLNQVFVRVAGRGYHLAVQPRTPGLSLCIGAGPIGTVTPTQDPA